MSGALDARIFRLVHDALSGNHALLYLMAALTVVGSGWTMILFALLFVRQRTRRFGAALLVTLGVTSLVVFLLKHVVGRLRPCACLPDVHALVFAAPSDPSFPSGHAAGAFAFAAFVSLVMPREPQRRHKTVVVLAFAGAAAIGLSRIALGVHFPGDVVAGAAIGTLLGTAGARVHLRRVGQRDLPGTA